MTRSRYARYSSGSRGCANCAGQDAENVELLKAAVSVATVRACDSGILLSQIGQVRGVLKVPNEKEKQERMWWHCTTARCDAPTHAHHTSCM